MKRTDFQPMLFSHPSEAIHYETALFVIKKDTNELYGGHNRKVLKYALDHNWYIPLWTYEEIRELYASGDNVLDDIKIPYGLEKKLWESVHGD